MIKSYLEGRFQAVSVGSIVSNFLPVKTGVPQGSILGPMLFSLYVNDLPEVIKSCSYHMYADDVQVYFSCCVSDLNNALIAINNDLNEIYTWSCDNKLVLNPNKTKCLVIYKKPFPTHTLTKLQINSTPIDYVDRAKNLGFIVNNTLDWNAHINDAICRTIYKLRTLWHSQRYIPENVRMLIAKTYLLPTLFYGVELFAACGPNNEHKLKVAFNNIARYVFAIKRGEHITQSANKIFGMPFKNYLKLRTLLYLHKIVHTKEPEYLYSKLQFSQSSRVKNIVPRRYAFLNSERHFFIFAVRLWNELGMDLKHTQGPMRFKTKLKLHFSCDT